MWAKPHVVPRGKYRCLYMLKTVIRQDQMREFSKCGRWVLCIYVGKRELEWKRPTQREKKKYQVTGETKNTGWVIFLVFLEEFSPRSSVCSISKTLVRSASCTHTQLIHLWRLWLNRRISWNEMWRNVDQNINKWLPCTYQTYISCQNHHEPCKPIKMISIIFFFFYWKWGDSNPVKERSARVKSRVQTKYFSLSLLASACSAIVLKRFLNKQIHPQQDEKEKQEGGEEV